MTVKGHVISVEINDPKNSIIAFEPVIELDPQTLAKAEDEIKKMESEPQSEVIDDSIIEFNELIKPGKKGITNAQMIPALKKVIHEGDEEKLKLLQQIQPEAYQNSLRYLGKKELKKLEFLLSPAS